MSAIATSVKMPLKISDFVAGRKLPEEIAGDRGRE
jgi:hypothetical protein